MWSSNYWEFTSVINIKSSFPLCFPGCDTLMSLRCLWWCKEVLQKPPENKEHWSDLARWNSYFERFRCTLLVQSCWRYLTILSDLHLIKYRLSVSSTLCPCITSNRLHTVTPALSDARHFLSKPTVYGPNTASRPHHHEGRVKEEVECWNRHTATSCVSACMGPCYSAHTQKQLQPFTFDLRHLTVTWVYMLTKRVWIRDILKG